ncbi:radical SAM family heme chaperone HemW [Croceivirga sp. JEA036]|uniref:radical SAM family heme chaperone HemW n=1 Tax=Croceivirga sp. JEA036 TaxID=2721162 RepID=UPI00143C4208|nr:radical SAM family heme chaperone HemW [Croceivirga sp. JEA036]NJB36318.1 radical SAM family heme chaperone HemW [Croceivirga sp. JEA036]
MAGIYIHIPFCKQACHYCDFHFSTSLKHKDGMLQALAKELQLRKSELEGKIIETIYFGGGTPSVLSNAEIELLIAAVYANFKVIENPEITLEANPDDLSVDRIVALAATPINRLSIGVQSFLDKDLKLMNRAHDAKEAMHVLTTAVQYFPNTSLDLIYGIPNQTDAEWQQNIKRALDFGVPHISSYALTVEPKTALEKFISKGLVPKIDDEQAQRQFMLLVDTLEQADFINYEISNFGKKDYFSKNNTAYWLGKSYLGIGPSAHSFNGVNRGWNVRNNQKYIKAIQEEQLPIEIETLTTRDRYNEYIMTGLRTIWGVSLIRLKEEFGERYKKYALQQAEKYVEEHLLFLEDNVLRTTKKGKFLADGIASDLFMINL